MDTNKNAKKKYHTSPSSKTSEEIEGHTEKRAEAASECLEKVHWHNPNDSPTKDNPESVMDEKTKVDDLPLSKSELDLTVRRLKNHKAPGPDKYITELFEHVNRENKEILFRTLNEIWGNEEVTKKKKKKRKHRSHVFFYQRRYRTTRKRSTDVTAKHGFQFVASMIQVRLAEKMGNYIQNAQYGFRAKQSTAQALFHDEKTTRLRSTHRRQTNVCVSRLGKNVRQDQPRQDVLSSP